MLRGWWQIKSQRCHDNDVKLMQKLSECHADDLNCRSVRRRPLCSSARLANQCRVHSVCQKYVLWHTVRLLYKPLCRVKLMMELSLDCITCVKNHDDSHSLATPHICIAESLARMQPRSLLDKLLGLRARGVTVGLVLFRVCGATRVGKLH